jgi:hypothetical protein
MSDLWVPITAMLSISIVIIVGLALSAHHKKHLQLTLQKHLENGGTLTSELLGQLGTSPSSRHGDRRKGLVLVSAGLACLVAGWSVGDLDVGIMFGVFPVFIGVAFLISAYLTNDE